LKRVQKTAGGGAPDPKGYYLCGEGKKTFQFCIAWNEKGQLSVKANMGHHHNCKSVPSAQNPRLKPPLKRCATRFEKGGAGERRTIDVVQPDSIETSHK